jgi:hypothetical protein
LQLCCLALLCCFLCAVLLCCWYCQVGYFHAYLDGVDYVFVDHPSFHYRAKDIYGGERQEIQFRCALLCKAALESVWHVPFAGVPYGDNNTVFIANDWHTALLPVYLQVGGWLLLGDVSFQKAAAAVAAEQQQEGFAGVGSAEPQQQMPPTAGTSCNHPRLAWVRMTVLLGLVACLPCGVLCCAVLCCAGSLP